MFWFCQYCHVRLEIRIILFWLNVNASWWNRSFTFVFDEIVVLLFVVLCQGGYLGELVQWSDLIAVSVEWYHSACASVKSINRGALTRRDFVGFTQASGTNHPGSQTSVNLVGFCLCLSSIRSGVWIPSVLCCSATLKLDCLSIITPKRMATAIFRPHTQHNEDTEGGTDFKQPSLSYSLQALFVLGHQVTIHTTQKSLASHVPNKAGKVDEDWSSSTDQACVGKMPVTIGLFRYSYSWISYIPAFIKTQQRYENVIKFVIFFPAVPFDIVFTDYLGVIGIHRQNLFPAMKVCMKTGAHFFCWRLHLDRRFWLKFAVVVSWNQLQILLVT